MVGSTSNKNASRLTSTRNRQMRLKLGRILGLLFGFSFLMACGPGLWFVNYPFFVGPIPLAFAWAILWFTVNAVCILIAYRWLWTAEDSE